MKVSTLMYEITNEGYILFDAKERNCDYYAVVLEGNPSIGVCRTINLIGETIPVLIFVYYDKDMISAVYDCNKIADKLWVINHACMINNYLITAYYYLTEDLDESILLAEKLNKKIKTGNNIMKELKNE